VFSSVNLSKNDVSPACALSIFKYWHEFKIFSENENGWVSMGNNLQVRGMLYQSRIQWMSAVRCVPESNVAAVVVVFLSVRLETQRCGEPSKKRHRAEPDISTAKQQSAYSK